MADISIETVDPFDEPLLHEWWSIGHAVHQERPYDLGLSWDFTRSSLRRPNPEQDTTLLAAFDADGSRRMVGAATLHLPLNDNTHTAFVGVDVPAEHRRRGVGSRLLTEVEERVGKAGRSHVLAEAFCPPGGSSAGRLTGYRIVTWGAETPEEYVESYCRLLSVFIREIPTEGLALEDSEWTPARVRAHEERGREIGRVSVVAGAVAPDGTLAGVHDLRPSTPDLDKAFIGLTLVAPEHRGHSLGLAMKLASHRELRAAYPQCRVVATSNAGVNEHMNAINEGMGYRVVEDIVGLQKAL